MKIKGSQLSFTQLPLLSTTNVTISEVKVKSLSHVRLFATPWTVAYQAPPSMGFSKQEYWSGVPFPKALQSMFVINAIVIMIFSVYKLGLNM